MARMWTFVRSSNVTDPRSLKYVLRKTTSVRSLASRARRYVLCDHWLASQAPKRIVVIFWKSVIQMEDAHSSELVVIARAVKPRGLKGEIVAELLTDFPERFEDVEELVLVSPGGERTTKRLEDYWIQNGRVVLKL